MGGTEWLLLGVGVIIIGLLLLSAHLLACRAEADYRLKYELRDKQLLEEQLRRIRTAFSELEKEVRED